MLEWYYALSWVCHCSVYRRESWGTEELSTYKERWSQDLDPAAWLPGACPVDHAGSLPPLSVLLALVASCPCHWPLHYGLSSLTHLRCISYSGSAGDGSDWSRHVHYGVLTNPCSPCFFPLHLPPPFISGCLGVFLWSKYCGLRVKLSDQGKWPFGKMAPKLGIRKVCGCFV